MCDTSMMPLRVAMPNSVMNPIIDATLSTPPARNTPATPPISASGRFTMTSSASRARPNASTSSMNSPATTPTPSTSSRCGRALLAFELPAVLDAVARRHGDRLRHGRPDVVDDAAQIAAGDVGGDDDPALHVLAQNHVRPLLAPDVGEQPDRHGGPARRVDRQIGDPVEVGLRARVELDDEIERRRPDRRCGRPSRRRSSSRPPRRHRRRAARSGRSPADSARSARTECPSAARATGRRRPARRS